MSLEATGKQLDRPARHFARDVAAMQRSRVRALTAAVEAVDGVNMGQGSNLLPTPPPLIDAAWRAMRNGHNDYASQEGIVELRVAIARVLREENAVEVDANTELRITSGATGGFVSCCRALLQPGDEVVLLEPYYPYHLTNLALLGCGVRFARLHPPEWRLDINALAAVCTDRTRVIVLCNPSNPTSRVYRPEELQALVTFCRARNLVIISDEVYAHLTYDGHHHTSIASLPGARDHVLTLASFSKSHAVTGWRLGYLYGPEDLVERVTLVHDAIYACAPRPLQHAMAEVIAGRTVDSNTVRQDFAWRRTEVTRALESAGFDPLPVEGSYFVLAAYGRRFGPVSSSEACMRLLKESRIATVPVSAFYHDDTDMRLLRFAYALPADQIERVVQLLAAADTDSRPSR